MGRGKRYSNDTPKLNIKKVIAVVIAILVVVMFVISLKNLLSKQGNNTKEVSTLTTYFSIYENNKWGVIDQKGNTIIEPTYEEMIIIPNKNKDLFVCTYDVDYQNETYKTKVVNASNEEILSQYENIETLENTDGTSVWYEDNILKYGSNNQYGLINFDGKEILSATYDNIYVLDGVEKSIIIEKNGRKGLVSSSTGEIIIHPEYTDITALSDTNESGYIVKNQDGKSGVIALDKKVILDTKYDEIKKVSGNNEYYVVVENGKLEIVNTQGNVVLNEGFDSVEAIQSNMFIIIKDGKYGVISSEGQSIIPAEYEDLKFISNQYFIAKKDGKYGMIDTNHQVKVDFTYTNMYYVKSADFIEAENDHYKTDIYNANLDKVLEDVIVSELNVEKGYLRIRKENAYQYYNFKFEEKTNFEVLSTNTLFLFQENGKYGYKNKNKETIVDAIYDDATEQNAYGYCAVKKDGLWGALKADGTVILKPSVNLDEALYIDFISTWHRNNDAHLDVYIP